MQIFIIEAKVAVFGESFGMSLNQNVWRFLLEYTNIQRIPFAGVFACNEANVRLKSGYS
jgi:hypothetical protein